MSLIFTNSNGETFEIQGPELKHYGILGQKWGVRRFQNEDGTLTPAGKARYNKLTSDVKKAKIIQEKYDPRFSTYASYAKKTKKAEQKRDKWINSLKKPIPQQKLNASQLKEAIQDSVKNKWPDVVAKLDKKWASRMAQYNDWTKSPLWDTYETEMEDAFDKLVEQESKKLTIINSGLNQNESKEI